MEQRVRTWPLYEWGAEALAYHRPSTFWALETTLQQLLEGAEVQPQIEEPQGSRC